MNFNEFQYLLPSLIIFLAGFILSSAVFEVFAVSDISVRQEVVGEVCNHNGICEPDLGENNINCPSDCFLAPLPPKGWRVDIISPLISELLISRITFNFVEISWKTNEPSLCQLFWGKTPEYEEGSISEIEFSFFHKTTLTNLLPQTTYHFKIKCRDHHGNFSETPDQKFITLTPPDTTPPLNVFNLEAFPGDKQIILRWQNPPDFDFKKVRIVRSERFYPRNPWEGEIVYEGRDTSFVDRGLINGKRYYYTLFSYDFAGNFSSGALISAIPQPLPLPSPEEILTEKECLEAGYFWYDGACHKKPKITPPFPEVKKLTLEEFDFIQEDKKLLIEEFKIEVKPKIPLTISIDYKKVPEIIRSIKISLEKEEKIFSYFLRLNEEKTAYLATFMAPEDPGDYSLTITFFNEKNELLGEIKGQLIVKEMEIKTFPLFVPWYKKYLDYILYGVIITGIGLFIFFIIFILRKRKKIED